jgi:hypothetical protein
MEGKENIEIINHWKSFDKKLEASLEINNNAAIEITKMKITSIVISMAPMKILGIIKGIVWAIILCATMFFFKEKTNLYFLISFGAIAFINVVAVSLYLRHLILIHQIDLNEPVIKTQENLSKMKSVILLNIRILFLQLPFWTIFYWNSNMLESSNTFLWLLQILFTLSFTVTALWFFFNINLRNKDKKWFKFMFNDKEWNGVFKAMELNNDIKEFKQE